MFVKVLLRLPSSTPLPAYRAETGLLGMKWCLWESKLQLVSAIREVDNSTLAKQVFQQQLDMKYEGLTTQVTVICRAIGIPDVCYEYVSKADIKEAIINDHCKELNKEMEKYVKLEQIRNQDTQQIQSYMTNKSLEFCRLAFRLRTRQFVCRANMPKMFNNERWCHNCCGGAEDGPGGSESPAETQEHIEVCEVYKHLRHNKDVELVFEDKVNYFMAVALETTRK